MAAILRRNCAILSKATIKSRDGSYVAKKAKFVKDIDDYLQSSKSRADKDFVPPTYKNCNVCPPESLICIDANTAAIIADGVASHITNGTLCSSPILEMAPGPGFVSKELLKRGAQSLRLYEPNPFLNSNLQQLVKSHKNRVQIFPHDLPNLPKITFEDQVRGTNKMDSIMLGINKKDPPEITCTVVGACPHQSFLIYIPYAEALGNGFPRYGLTEYFLVVHPYNYLRMSAQPKEHYYRYRYHTVALQIFYNLKVAAKLDRQSFLPWEKKYEPKSKDKQKELFSFEDDHLYLIHLTPKPTTYTLSALEKQQLWYFLRYHMVKRTALVTPLLEKWIPNCGPRLRDLDIYENTCIGELCPATLLNLFKAFISWPEFEHSSFKTSMEVSYLKSNFDNVQTSTPESQPASTMLMQLATPLIVALLASTSLMVYCRPRGKPERHARFIKFNTGVGDRMRIDLEFSMPFLSVPLRKNSTTSPIVEVNLKGIALAAGLGAVASFLSLSPTATEDYQSFYG